MLISFDVEATGSCPVWSMNMLGCVLFDSKTGEIFEQKAWYLKEVTEPEPRCMTEFWDKNKANLELIRSKAVDPEVAMADFAGWLKATRETYPDIGFMAAPATFDWSFLKYYYEKYGPKDKPELGYMAVCLSSIKRAFITYLGTPEQWAGIVKPPSHIKFTHLADEDALYQAHEYINYSAYMRGRFYKSI